MGMGKAQVCGQADSLLLLGAALRWSRWRCAPGNGCVKAAQLQQEDLSSGFEHTRDRKQVGARFSFFYLDISCQKTSTVDNAVIPNSSAQCASSGSDPSFLWRIRSPNRHPSGE